MLKIIDERLTFEEPHESVAYWPEGTCGNGDISRDTHPSKRAALAVCRLLQKNGFGGGGKIFPLKTEVVPIVAAPDKNCFTLPDGSCIGKNCMHDPSQIEPTLDALQAHAEKKWTMEKDAWDGGDGRTHYIKIGDRRIASTTYLPGAEAIIKAHNQSEAILLKALRCAVRGLDDLGGNSTLADIATILSA